MTSLERIAACGQSIWFDDLGRGLLRTGELERLVAEHSVTGVTTNPTILAKAISESSDYDDELARLFHNGAGVLDAYRQVVTTDIRQACDVLAPAWEASSRSDGFVSVEVSPDVAHDVSATLEEVRDWVKRVDRGNLLVKVPATTAGTEAFEELTAEGISINVTLIFSLQRYRDIAQRYIAGIERFVAAGGDPSKVHSVASFFVSRVDTEVDGRLDSLPSSPSIKALRGLAGIANARVAYGMFEELFRDERWRAVAERGAHVQRPLWASTGVKDPAYADTMYVDELVAPHTVNTMPLTTLLAVAEHGDPHVFDSSDVAAARRTLDELEQAGIDYEDVTATIEREGLAKFDASFNQVTALLKDKLDRSV